MVGIKYFGRKNSSVETKMNKKKVKLKKIIKKNKQENGNKLKKNEDKHFHKRSAVNIVISFFSHSEVLIIKMKMKMKMKIKIIVRILFIFLSF